MAATTALWPILIDLCSAVTSGNGQQLVTAAMDSPAAELNLRGVSVHWGTCERAGLCGDCLADLLQSLESYLALPGTMNESNERRFMKVSTAQGFAVEKQPEHRRDFVLPMSQPMDALLRATLSGGVGAVVVDALGEDAEICEMTVIVSEPGATAQPFHADSNWSEAAPRLVTMFLALHDVLDEALGPTRFCPGTHIPQSFPDNEWLSPTPGLVAERGGGVWFELKAGDAVLMDSTTWHSGGANTTTDRRRSLFSVSFVESTQHGADHDREGERGGRNLPLGCFMSN